MSENLWFKIESLQRLTDSRTWKKGSEIVFNLQVLSFELELIAKNSWDVFGRVQGTQRSPYQVQARIQFNADGHVLSWGSTCTCPVHYDCKHGMGVSLYAAFHGLELLQAKHPEGLEAHEAQRSKQFEAQQALQLQRKAELEALQAERSLLTWLDQLDQVSEVEPRTSVADVATRLRGSSHRSPPQYLYLLQITEQATGKPKLRIDTVSTHLKQNGQWAKTHILKSLPMEYEIAEHGGTRLDTDIMRLIADKPHLPNYYHEAASVSGQPNGRLGAMGLELAASTGRLHLSDGSLTPGITVRWGEPRTLSWAWQESPATISDDNTWVLKATFDTDHATTLLCFNTPPLYLDVEQGLCGQVVSQHLSGAQIETLLKAPALKASTIEKHQSALLSRLGIVPAPPALAEIRQLKGLTPKRLLHLRRKTVTGSSIQPMIEAQLTFDYAGHRGWWGDQPNTVTVQTPEGRLLLHRDVSFENETLDLLYFELSIDVNRSGLCSLAAHIPPSQWAVWHDQQFSDFTELEFEVSWDENLKNWVHHSGQLVAEMIASDPATDAEVSSDWFDLSLGIEIEGERRNILPFLPSLLADASRALNENEKGLDGLPPFIYLPDAQSGGYLRIPTEAMKPWLATMLEFFTERQATLSDEHLRLSRFDAMHVSAVVGQEVTWRGAQALRTLAQKLGHNAQLDLVSVPASVQAQLRPYQQDGLNWLQFLGQHGFGGILADDMGLGKTLQTLVHIQIEKDAGRLTTPALIIVPVSVLGNWQREASKFCPQLRTLIVHGKERHEAASNLSDLDVVIAPYSLLQRDRERWMATTWHIVVLDEAQNIKNSNTLAAQVVKELKAHQRLCLSGTPIENHLGEMWSLFHFLMPGFLGSQKRFSEIFRNPIEKQNNAGRLKSLRSRITPFMLRRTKAQVAGDLPPKIETTVRIELSGKQADLYETIRLTTEKAVRDALATQGFSKSRVTILDALLKLRQVCCDPRLVPSPAAKKINQSAKLAHLMDILPNMLAEGRRVLLFSQFTSMLTLIEAELAKYNLKWTKLTGSSQHRDTIVERFTSGEVPLFLISLKAGGVGLNLPQADTVIHYDPWWNPAVENQATDRAHRIGQTQKVWVIKLVAQGTIEERILVMQERKADLAESLYSDAVVRKQPLFSEQDLADLLMPLGG